MRIEIPYSHFRYTDSGIEVECHTIISGDVTVVPDEYRVMLDRKLDLRPDEIERAEQALIKEYDRREALALFPYVLPCHLEAA